MQQHALETIWRQAIFSHGNRACIRNKSPSFLLSLYYFCFRVIMKLTRNKACLFYPFDNISGFEQLMCFCTCAHHKFPRYFRGHQFLSYRQCTFYSSCFAWTLLSIGTLCSRCTLSCCHSKFRLCEFCLKQHKKGISYVIFFKSPVIFSKSLGCLEGWNLIRVILLR